MPQIPGTGLVYASNTFLVAPIAIFDTACIEPLEGGALVSLRSYLSANDTYSIDPIGTAGTYEMLSLQILFVESQLEAMDTLIAAAGLPVKGHRETKWDFTNEADTLWLVEEPQLSDLIWENPQVQDWTDITFEVGSSLPPASTTSTIGFKWFNENHIVDVDSRYGVPVDVDFHGLYTGTCRLFRDISGGRQNPDLTFATAVATPNVAEYSTQFEEIKLKIDDIDFILPQYAENTSSPLYRLFDTSVIDVEAYFVANDGVEITVQVMGRRPRRG